MADHSDSHTGPVRLGVEADCSLEIGPQQSFGLVYLSGHFQYHWYFADCLSCAQQAKSISKG